MIEIRDNRLVVSFPEVHPDAKGTIEFQRTLRIPDDNRPYSLPPGFRRFPLNHVDDFKNKLPERWGHHGGIFFPMYQAEAMWINFSGDYPMAIKVAAGKINAVTGNAWNNDLHQNPQDYVVLSKQPWLDGYNVSEDMIRQFVAMPLGEGYTAEEQLTGEAIFGGLQIIVYPMKAEEYELSRKQQFEIVNKQIILENSINHLSLDMGLAPGGLMHQEVFEDPYGLVAWDMTAMSRCYVHIANSKQYQGITGKQPPYLPPSADSYTKAGLPWFDYYDEESNALAGAKKLAGLDSVAAKGTKMNKAPLLENDPVTPEKVINIKPKKRTVREGIF